ncbi:hypothetical protein RFI_29355 [Reticulomyxa filosa]|uniref:Caspase family p20 domain-containing protein n=1 Tax=Reticulomyxa filosa TaxID=46433 RepID=X6M317_RETFI|nr:hypothetical protein RFI_29355 [Reticulomyxa filosa]|eukprot:ETO08036.1 hypothetical protein RFI_29355 [Reticulomyxa filosa]
MDTSHESVVSCRIYLESEDSKDDIKVEERMKQIEMKELTFEELLRQSYNCLEWSDFQKMRNENLKLELADMNKNIIGTDESVKEILLSDDPSFKIIWTSLQQQIIFEKTKTIKNALVIMIAISEYMEDTGWINLKNVKNNDITNFQKLFQKELKYKFICNDNPKMNKNDINEFLTNIIVEQQLYKNSNKYDALIMIISGHGDDEMY